MGSNNDLGLIGVGWLVKLRHACKSYGLKSDVNSGFPFCRRVDRLDSAADNIAGPDTMIFVTARGEIPAEAIENMNDTVDRATNNPSIWGRR